ncbi:helix-turn-helix domain-containing protein [Catellatospora sp. KI3]|uniref:MarR family transcriptional regulator n=1 Tax=Catellatospora sp. KI3 TaxID=3041620 RepID=UPI0024825860|nr:helix-turn-helix domain-containing protein [Catellatospora sp. KI3]MDI1464609.1 helix-turn-helix domain-containing protein [Catellatospora sp. KI3]
MNGVDLFLLGRTLMKIGQDAIPTPADGPRQGAERTVLIVAADVAAHPGSSISEITERTGFPQSAVSGSVARLREAGAVRTRTDPGDRRRQLVHPAEQVSDRVAEIRATGVEAALAAALGPGDPGRLAEVTAALDALARHLAPAALTKLRRPGGTG